MTKISLPCNESRLCAISTKILKYVCMARDDPPQACETQSDAVTATLAWSLQLNALMNFQEEEEEEEDDDDELLLPVLRLAGKLPSASNEGNITDELRRNCRLLMSLMSISSGNFTIPRRGKYHFGFDEAFLLLSDFPTLLTEALLSISKSDDVLELPKRRSLW